MQPLEDKKRQATPDNETLAKVFMFSLTVLPCERFGAEPIFEEVATSLIANIRNLSRQLSLSRKEKETMEATAYLLTSAWIGSPKKLRRSLGNITEFFFRSFPRWRNSRRKIHQLLRAVVEPSGHARLSRQAALFQNAVALSLGQSPNSIP